MLEYNIGAEEQTLTKIEKWSLNIPIKRCKFVK